MNKKASWSKEDNQYIKSVIETLECASTDIDLAIKRLKKHNVCDSHSDCALAVKHIVEAMDYLMTFKDTEHTESVNPN